MSLPPTRSGLRGSSQSPLNEFGRCKFFFFFNPIMPIVRALPGVSEACLRGPMQRVQRIPTACFRIAMYSLQCFREYPQRVSEVSVVYLQLMIAKASSGVLAKEFGRASRDSQMRYGIIRCWNRAPGIPGGNRHRRGRGPFFVDSPLAKRTEELFFARHLVGWRGATSSSQPSRFLR